MRGAPARRFVVCDVGRRREGLAYVGARREMVSALLAARLRLEPGRAQGVPHPPLLEPRVVRVVALEPKEGRARYGLTVIAPGVGTLRGWVYQEQPGGEGFVFGPARRVGEGWEPYVDPTAEFRAQLVTAARAAVAQQRTVAAPLSEAAQ